MSGINFLRPKIKNGCRVEDKSDLGWEGGGGGLDWKANDWRANEGVIVALRSITKIRRVYIQVSRISF